MQKDFHYYATYCAAFLAGYTHEECMQICYSAQFVDCCSQTFLENIHAPKSAATTQLPLELVNCRTDLLGLQNITRIWASFHFLPRDLENPNVKGLPRYKNKYRLICGPNGDLIKKTVELAKGESLPAVGLAMHVLADTWAHQYFAGTPSLVINNTTTHFYELLPDGTERKITFRHSAGTPDDLNQGLYTASLFQGNENSIMNLGHGRAGHLPDYSFIRYKYLPAWGHYQEIIKDNPADYLHAFTQMIYAMQYLRGSLDHFETDRYAEECITGLRDRIQSLLTKRQLDSSEDWRRLGEELSGKPIEDFSITRYEEAYLNAPAEEKSSTFLGQFILAALAQKSMVTGQIFQSGNHLAGYAVDYKRKGFRGIRDFAKLIEHKLEKEDFK